MYDKTADPEVPSINDILLFLVKDWVISCIVVLYKELLIVFALASVCVGLYLLNFVLSKTCGSINNPVLFIDFCGVNFLKVKI